jgi:ribosomal protein L35AE/L33A
MSEKSKKTTSKKPTAKKPAAKKTTSKKTPVKKTATTAKKKPTTKKTTTTKKPAAKKTTTKTKPKSRKLKTIKAKILSYRRNNRLQTTNQAIAKILDDYNHKALIGKKFILKFPDSDASAKGVVTAIHGKSHSKQVRIRFDKAGMSAHALNLIGEIYI